MDYLTTPNFIFSPSPNTNMSEPTQITATIQEERVVRARYVHGYGLQPYDESVRLPRTMVEVGMDDLMSENPERQRAIMYHQLMRIVSGSTTSKEIQSKYKSYYKKGGEKSHTSGLTYYRLFLFRDLSCRKGQVVYVVESKNMNDKFWNRFSQLRDNGVVSIGTVVGVINPLPISTWFSNDIPILESRSGCIVFQPPSRVIDIGIDNTISGQVTRAFVMNHLEISVFSSSPYTTTCSGHLCDKQRSVEVSRDVRTCGCYHMQHRVGNICINHDIGLSKNNKSILVMQDFSSSRLTNLYLKNPFDCNVKWNMLDGTEMFFHLQDCIAKVVRFINDNGGFTVIGWYKKGNINDVSTEESDNKIESSEIGFHIVGITPTNDLILHHDSYKGKTFDISNIPEDINE